jgi:hypothetical protein
MKTIHTPLNVAQQNIGSLLHELTLANPLTSTTVFPVATKRLAAS